jgi:hypothetical protein
LIDFADLEELQPIIADAYNELKRSSDSQDLFARIVELHSQGYSS